MEVFRVGIVQNPERIKRWPHKAREKSGLQRTSSAFFCLVRQADVRQCAIRGRAKSSEHRSWRRIVGWLSATALLSSIMSRERRIDGGGVRVIHAVMHGSNQSCSMHLLRKSRQMLADRNTSEAAGDRIEFTTDLTRCFRLHVPHIKMAWTAVKEQHDAVVSLSC